MMALYSTTAVGRLLGVTGGPVLDAANRLGLNPVQVVKSTTGGVSRYWQPWQIARMAGPVAEDLAAQEARERERTAERAAERQAERRKAEIAAQAAQDAHDAAVLAGYPVRTQHTTVCPHLTIAGEHPKDYKTAQRLLWPEGRSRWQVARLGACALRPRSEIAADFMLDRCLATLCHRCEWREEAG